MKPWLALILGILVGWLIGWLFERWWSRRRSVAGVQKPEAGPAQSDEIELPRIPPASSLASAEAVAPAAAAAVATAASLEEHEYEAPPEVNWEELRAEVEAQQVEVTPEIERQASIGVGLPEELEEAPALTGETPASGPGPAETEMPAGLSEAAVAATAPTPDDLTVIEGIGPVYAAKLNAAGITTFARLADSNPPELAGIIEAPSWRKMYFEEWIQQAALLRDQEHERLKELQARLFRRKKE